MAVASDVFACLLFYSHFSRTYFIIIYFLLTEREGLTGGILPEVFLLQTERSEVRIEKD